MNSLDAQIKVSVLDRASGAFDKIGNRANALGRGMGGLGQGSALLSRGLGALGITATGVAVGLGKAFVEYASFDKTLRQFGNTVGVQGDKLQKWGHQIRDLAPAVLQTQDDLLTAAQTLAGRGLSGDEAVGSLRIIGQAATATGADVNDMALAGFAAIDNLKFSVKDLAQVFDMLDAAGKAGGFELKDMARWMPELSAQFVGLGETGTVALADIAAAAEVALKNAGSTDQAANNLSNFLGKLTASETQKRLKKFGINVKSEMDKAAKNGESIFTHMVQVIADKTKGDPFKIAEMFPDRQASDFLRAVLQNFDEFLKIKGQVSEANGVIKEDFDNVSKSASGALDKLSNQWTRAKSLTGELIAPAALAGLEKANAVLADFPVQMARAEEAWKRGGEKIGRDYKWALDAAEALGKLKSATEALTPVGTIKTSLGLTDVPGPLKRFTPTSVASKILYDRDQADRKRRESREGSRDSKLAEDAKTALDWANTEDDRTAHLQGTFEDRMRGGHAKHMQTILAYHDALNGMDAETGDVIDRMSAEQEKRNRTYGPTLTHKPRVKPAWIRRLDKHTDKPVPVPPEMPADLRTRRLLELPPDKLAIPATGLAVSALPVQPGKGVDASIAALDALLAKYSAADKATSGGAWAVTPDKLNAMLNATGPAQPMELPPFKAGALNEALSGKVEAQVTQPVKAELQGQGSVTVRVQIDGPGRVTGMSVNSEGHISLSGGIDNSGRKNWRPHPGQE